MNMRLFLLPLIFAAVLFPKVVSAKVLIIVEKNYYNISTQRISQYATDVRLYDNKTVDIVPWTSSVGTNVQQCKALWTFLEDKYNSSILTNDRLEGTVLIGNVPVPQTFAGSSYYPFDYYYMDIWDSRTDQAYPNHASTPFNIDTAHAGYFSTKYNVGSGDSKMDIWVSRIYGVLLAANKHLRSSAPGGNPNAVLDSIGIYNEYLDRLHKRYTEPALVPSRGFAMGGTADMIVPLQDALGMQQLNLPMYVEFNGSALINTGDASSFNLMSQLQSGPKGGTTFGAYNGTTFPNDRNARNCQYFQLPDARSYAPYNNRVYSNLDDNGWEWAGIYSHSSAFQFAFNNGNGVNYNGGFRAATAGPFWGNNQRRAGGYVPLSGNPEGMYYYYNDNAISSDPYGMGLNKDKRAFFQYKIHASGSYSIYLNYPDDINNCSNAQVTLVESRLNSSGYPAGGRAVKNTPYFFSMKSHINRDGNSNWERVFSDIDLADSNMATLIIEANGQDGEVVADAIRFVCTSPEIDEVVDNAEPTINPDGSKIFSTQGFFTSDCVDRSFESMQDENSVTHDKFSKVPFFLLSTCGVNNFLWKSWGNMDNLGNLLALGHNGLISMGTSDGNYPGKGYTSFVSTIASGKSFGQAFLDQVNSSFIVDKSNNLNGMYALLGAGNPTCATIYSI